MTFDIRDAAPGDAKACGFVHYHAWIETYTGLISDVYLASLSPAKSARRFAEKKCRDMVVLTADGRAVGFAVYGKTRDGDLPETFGDIHAIYILREYQKLGQGRKLLEAAIDRLRRQGMTIFPSGSWRTTRPPSPFTRSAAFAMTARPRSSS
ncbi:Acetyltransferase (GNAT) domain-containing protein [Sporobacter termitidis DSM 10068]|uniref:Acetyltransferase (GNAT) domain-containing protein n=1 Tax=Sporobacter termitidis DSM 10068 TaxID=1123282 RepID=A0A1M5Y376_9FIRM|nr:GNAT family N-acetyltransferase [Sporobacter termitidis]SHI06389.1 Acetyltransferase (GNAT) domain-containing protein [Sporobacter termitidis DSM 10068]